MPQSTANEAAIPTLTSDDVGRLVRRASGRGHTGERNRALVCAFAGARLGVAEAFSLTPAHIDQAGGQLEPSWAIPASPAPGDMCAN